MLAADQSAALTMNSSAASSDHSIRARLDATLGNGNNAEQLMLEIVAICGSDANNAWAVLALVDQYYRRGRISDDVYRGVKFQIQRMALGHPVATTPAPTARAEVPKPKPVAAPAATTAAVPPPAAPSPTIRPGSVLRDRYVLEASLNYGGEDPVYRALDRYRADMPDHEQRVAVKFPKQPGEAHREFFRAQPLAHPNIARVLEFYREGELAYYTLELLNGKVLREALEELPATPLPMAQALTIVREVGAALVYAHEHNVVHGALDTSSVLITTDGKVHVMNFGSLQTESLQLEPRDDLNTLACLAYELLAGAHPFQGHSLIVARQLGLRAKRPPRLHRGQWRALQQGLAWSRKHKVLLVRDWLPRLEMQRAAIALPPLAELLATKPARRWSKTAIAAGIVAAGATAAVLLAFIDPDGFRAGYETLGTLAGSSGNAAGPAMPPPAAMAAPGSQSAVAASPIPARVSPVPAPNADTTTEPVVDNRPGRISFLTQSFMVPQEAAAASILVRRSSGTHGDIHFSWWTDSGSAKAGDDFMWSGNQHELIPDGQDSVTLLVPLVSAPRVPGKAEFYVSLGSPTGGASLGAISRVTVIVARP
jgi:Protein kinase domain